MNSAVSDASSLTSSSAVMVTGCDGFAETTPASLSCSCADTGRIQPLTHKSDMAVKMQQGRHLQRKIRTEGALYVALENDSFLVKLEGHAVGVQLVTVADYLDRGLREEKLFFMPVVKLISQEP